MDDTAVRVHERIMETVTTTVTREVPQHIADLVRFARIARDLLDGELVAAARAFYDEQHGED